MQKHRLLRKGFKGFEKDTAQSAKAILGARTESDINTAEVYAPNNKPRN